MDGIFLLDFIKDIPDSVLHPYNYTIQYYAKYPALSIGYRPAFFPFIEAIFYSIFGLSHISGKIAVFCFLMFGMIFWYLLVNKTHDTNIALISLLLWVTNPFIYEYSQYTMLEIPTLSMTIICVYLLYSFCLRISFQKAAILGLTVGLTIWTNQKGGFVLLLLLIYPITIRKIRLLFAKETLLAYAIILIFLIPLAMLTVWLGDQNIQQSIGLGLGLKRFYVWKHLIKNFIFLFKNHFSMFLLILILAGVYYTIKEKRSNTLIHFSVILAVYIFFTYIRHKIPRYCMYWIPFFCLFAALGLQQIVSNLNKYLNVKHKAIVVVIFSLPIFYQISFFPNAFVSYAAGYEDAAQYVLRNSKSPIVFFEGYANGQFIFFARIHDHGKKLLILRGDKIISSSAITYKHKLAIHLKNKEEMLNAIHDMGVQFIVIESMNISDLEIYDEFRELLTDQTRFKLHKVIEVKSNLHELRNQTLLVYEYLSWKGIRNGKMLRLRLPIVGKTIEIQMEKLN